MTNRLTTLYENVLCNTYPHLPLFRSLEQNKIASFSLAKL